jgi:hypothetical protein
MEGMRVEKRVQKTGASDIGDNHHIFTGNPHLGQGLIHCMQDPFM